MNSKLPRKHASPASAVWLLVLCLACSTRHKAIDELCEQLRTCQTGLNKRTVRIRELSELDAQLKTACEGDVTEQLVLGQLSDVRMLECQKCVKSLGSGDKQCEGVYIDHKCDPACDGIRWVTDVHSSFDVLSATCANVITSCDFSTPPPALPDGVAGAGGATVTATTMSISSASDSSTVSGDSDLVNVAGMAGLPAIPSHWVPPCLAAGAPSLPPTGATNGEAGGVGNASNPASQDGCLLDLQKYLWGIANRMDGSAGSAGAAADAAGTSSAPIPSGAVGIDQVSVQSLRECQSCILGLTGAATSGDKPVECQTYVTACSGKCAAVPSIGPLLGRSPAAYLCETAFDSCSTYVAPKISSIDCVTRVASTLKSEDMSINDCARCIRAKVGSSTPRCEALLEGQCGYLCGAQLESALFTESPPHRFCTAAPCICGTSLSLANCLSAVSSVSSDVGACLDCIAEGQRNCVDLTQDQAPCATWCKTVGATTID